MRPIKNSIESGGWKIGDIIQFASTIPFNHITSTIIKKELCIGRERCDSFTGKRCSGFYIVTKDRNIEGTMHRWHELYGDFRTVEGERNESH